MEDIGDIIYFLIIIFIAIVSSLGKKKKKKSMTAGKQTTQIPNIPSSWDELDRKLRKQSESVTQTRTAQAFETVQKTQMQQHPYSAKAEKNVPAYMSYETVDDVNKLRVKSQMKDSFSKNRSTFKSKADRDLESAATHFEVSLENLDDAKRAFVYSEIFTRKYD